MVDITEISAVVAAAGVLVGVVLAVLELRSLVKQRQAEVLLQLHSTWGSKEYRDSMVEVDLLEFEDYQDFIRKYGEQKDTPLRRAIWNISDFYEVMGVLVHKKLADISLIHDMFPVVSVWEKLEPIHTERRKELNTPELFYWFEYLYNEVKKRQQKLQQSRA
jgi:hypothetical protein